MDQEVPANCPVCAVPSSVAVQSQGEQPQVAGDIARRSIAFFGHDWTESTVVKRVTAFQANASHVVGFMFRRPRGTPPRPPGWDNVHLGVTSDRNYLARVPKLVAALVLVLKRWTILRRCQIFYARNIDMLFIAVVAKRLTGSRAAVVYEVLDVQRIFLGDRFINKAFRWAERALLKSCDMLVVSAPDFVSRYFAPVQKFAGPWRLLENKVAASQIPASMGAQRAVSPGPPWVIGWFGTLRCARSLNVLCHIADTLGDRVMIHLRGLPSEKDLPRHKIEQASATRANLVYGGPYASPRDLPAIYGQVHLAWCIDYLDPGTNSAWLLPNRIYEGGLFGSLALACGDTATARMVEREGLGWVLAEPLERTAVEFLETLDTSTYERARRTVGTKPRSFFVDETDTRDLLKALDEISHKRLVG
jgi:hypothetical protein